MVYCESCGAANETISEKCFVCLQPVVNTEELEIVSAQSAAHVEQDMPTLLEGRYQILKEVGTGGFGAVYKAVDTKFANRTVAIKEIRLQGLKPNEIIDATDTFNRELNILSDLRHPNLPRVYNHFTAPEHWYLVMDFIDGQTLETYLASKGGRLSLDEIFMLGTQICMVLDYLHTRQPAIIFRDLKPTNIMITSNKQIYLIDFGAARYFKAGRTKDTIAFGSPGYAAPEQYGKAQTTPRSDLYSLGATLHEALTGKDPAEDPFHFAPLRVPGQTIPPDLEALILRMVEMDMSKRPTSAAAVKAELWRISTYHTQRLYALPAMPSTMPPYRANFGVGQPPPAAWSRSAPSVQQAQIQLGFTPTPVARKHAISRRAITSMIILGVASVAFLENARTLWNHASIPYDMPATGQEPIMPQYRFEQLSTFTDHHNTVTSLNWSPVSNNVASGSLDRSLRIWNANYDGTEITHTMQDAVNAVGWSPDGAYVAAASGGTTGALEIWQSSAQGGDPPVFTFSHPTSGAFNALAWASSNPSSTNIALASDDGNVRVIDITTPATSKSLTLYSTKEPVLSLAWSPDGNYLVAGSADSTVHVFNTSPTPTPSFVFSQHTGSITGLAWTTDQNYIISGSSDMQVLIWNLNGRVVQKYPMTAPVSALALSSENLLAIGTEDGNIAVYNLSDANTPIYLVRNSGAIRSISWSSDGSFFVVGGDSGQATVWNVTVENIPWRGNGPQGGDGSGPHHPWGG
jgi:eukaryotic-like serine/threonine-protein kinase